jgi:hypothetical protein
MFASNDNASDWQGYIGYPIVAVLLVLGRIPHQKGIADALRGIAWKNLNDAHKRNYNAAIEEALSDVDNKGATRAAVEAEVDNIAAALKELRLEKLSPAKAQYTRYSWRSRNRWCLTGPGKTSEAR